LAVAFVSPARAWQARAADPQEARSAALETELPVDPDVRVGTFDNGLRYYIRANGRPENRAELRLVVNAGAVLEEDDQRGMAHLLEHMAFNGTANFEKNELIEFMESIGMRLGPDVNAYTSFDETVYMLQVPTDNPEFISTAFQIMEDWSHAVTLDDAEIDNERGVVVEEWRLGQGAFNRVNDKQFPIIFKDSRYAERLPIGTKESIETASHEAIRRFYEDWYRPDLMAVIAVGDFDPDVIEGLIRQHFEGLEPAAAARPRTMFDVPDQPGTDFAIATDPELPNTSVAVYYKMERGSDGTVGDYRQGLVESLYNSMLNGRLSELTQQADPPIAFGASMKGAMVRTKGMYQLFAGVQGDGIERGLETLLTEAARVEQFGFTQSELDRTKANMLRGIERAFDERANRRSSVFVNEYTRAYLENEPIPGLDYEFELYQRFLPEITLAEVNEVGRGWIRDDNRVLVVSAPENEDIVVPSEEALLNVLDTAADKELEPYEDTVSEAPLLPEIPDPGSIVEEREVGVLDVVEWRLSNGALVVLKPTDLRDDEILFRAYSPGGTSLVSDDDYVIASTATAAMNISGLGDFNTIDLRKKMAGKAASVSPSIGAYSEGLGGQASPKDLETLFQLAYLRFTAPRADPVAFEAYLTQGRSALANQEATPSFQLAKRLTEIRWQNHPRRQTTTVETLDEWDLDRSFAFYKERFADASDFIFVFVGTFDLETMRPLVERYLASLPSLGREETWRDVGIRHVQGVVEETVYAGVEPQSQTRMYFTGPFDYERQRRTTIRAMGLILQTRLRDVLREELSGTYGVGVSASYAWQPTETYTVSINFGSDPERVDELAAVVFAEIEKLKESPPEVSEVTDVQENFSRSFETDTESNSWWMSQIGYKYQRGEALDDLLTYQDAIDALTPADIQAAAQSYFNMSNFVRVTLLPEQQR
jgi:zinc protease